MLAKNTDETLLQKITKTHEKNNLIMANKFANNNFTIIHTQSNVCYTINGFRNKNMDEVN
jgi:myosin heavy subunit